jgi:hypothetical protein
MKDLYTEQKLRNPTPRPIADTREDADLQDLSFAPAFTDQPELGSDFDQPFEPTPLFDGDWQLGDERNQFMRPPMSAFDDISFE